MTPLPVPQYYCGALSPLTTTPRRRGVDTPYDRSPSATSPTNGAGSSARRAAQSSACFEGSTQRPTRPEWLLGSDDVLLWDANVPLKLAAADPSAELQMMMLPSSTSRGIKMAPITD